MIQSIQESNLKLKEFVEQYGQPFSDALGIQLTSHRNKEILKWFLASILYSKLVRESTATKTYKIFDEEGIVTPTRIRRAGWENIVSILDQGGYTRYDFSTADRLLEIFKNLQSKYSGDLNRVHAVSKDPLDLEDRLKHLGKGIGDTTVSIFLRDMRGVWSKADPRPSRLVEMGMKELGMKNLKKYAKTNGMNIIRLETALLKLAKDFLRKGKKIEIQMK